MKIDYRKVKIFKISNRKGYACLCANHLTEGKTAFQAYQRMVKALRRSGIDLISLDIKGVNRLKTDV
ncbi:MAG: hypothetical protein ABH858_00495 [Candidatus Omnitrophota bacterium]